MTDPERITALEVQVQGLRAECSDMNSKLDDLLALRNKGAGVFWLVSIVIGSGIIGGVLQLINWIGGKG